jgi:DNA-directed RNA polymerase subunit RPC12/RpoP
MNYSKEIIYHFVCQRCDLWWSIAAENIGIDKKTWVCPWCGHKHLPPHRDTSHYFGTTQSKRGTS